MESMVPEQNIRPEEVMESMIPEHNTDNMT